MQKVFLFVGALFSIIGNIVGAGFITGREISTFFCDDFSVSLCYSTFLIFVLFLYISLSFDLDSDWIFARISAFLNVIISSSMISGLNEIYCNLFLCQTENIENILIVTVFLAFFISLKGIGYINSFSLIFIPVSLVVLFFAIFSVSSVGYGNLNLFSSERGIDFFHSPVIYVCMNTFLSFPILKTFGKKFSKKGNLLLSFILSFILTFLIFIISNSVISGGVSGETMPLISLVEGNDFLYSAILFICFIGIFSTLACSYYSTISTFKKEKYPLKIIVLFLSTIWLSKLGFENIVSFLYPFIGILGLFYVFFNIFSKAFFLREKSKNTLLPQKRIK